MENPVVTIEMENGGIITAELYPDVAPQSVYNFISLANSVRRTSPAFATPMPNA